MSTATTEYRTKGIYVTDKAGHVDALFVLPYEPRQFDTVVMSSPAGKEILASIDEALRTYAVVTLKPTSGPWSSASSQSRIMEERVPWLEEQIAKYTPNVVVFLSIKAAQQCIPELKDKKRNELFTKFHQWRIRSGNTSKRQLCFVYDQPQNILEDWEDNFRLPEMFARIRAASRGLGYNRDGEIKNLSYKNACKYIDYLCEEYDGMIGFDTETYSLNQVHNTRLGSMQFSTDTDTAYVILWDTDYCDYTPKEKEHLREKLMKLFGSKRTTLEGWVMHNAPFDMNQVFAEFGVRFPYEKKVHDTALLLHLLDENRINRGGEDFKLKNVAKDFLGYYGYDDEALEARSSGVIMFLPKPKLLKYGGTDPLVTLRIYRVLILWAKLSGYYPIMMRLTNKLHNRALRLYTEMKRNGFAVDQFRLRELLSTNSPIKKRLIEIEEIYRKDETILSVNEELYKLRNRAAKVFKVPFTFDMNKPAYRNELFFHSPRGLKLPPNDEGKFSSNKKFQELYAETHPLISLFAEAQGLSQLKKMYIQPIWISMTEGKTGDTADGRVHSNFNIGGTVTGRLSSSNPNSQQLPRSDTPAKKSIKALLVAMPEIIKSSKKPVTRALIQADFRAAEVRMWGAMSKDARLCKLLHESFAKCAEYRDNPNNQKLRDIAELMGDVHKQTAALMFGVDFYNVDWDNPIYKAMRQSTKSLTFGMMYGRGIPSIASQIKKSEEEAKALQDKFFGQFVEGKQWLDAMERKVKSFGYVETPFGRRRRMPQVFSGEKGMVKQALRFAVNAPIQATASDFAMYSTALLQERLLQDKLTDEFKIVNAVHDSVVVDFIADREHLEWLATLLRQQYTLDAPKLIEEDFEFKMLAPMDIDLEISYRKYKKCDVCQGIYHMHEGECTNKIKTGEKDEKGKPVYATCKKTKHHVEELRYHSYGYMHTLDETPRGFDQAVLAF